MTSKQHMKILSLLLTQNLRNCRNDYEVFHHVLSDMKSVYTVYRTIPVCFDRGNGNIISFRAKLKKCDILSSPFPPPPPSSSSISRNKVSQAQRCDIIVICLPPTPFLPSVLYLETKWVKVGPVVWTTHGLCMMFYSEVYPWFNGIIGGRGCPILPNVH
jgi:hypothetical protein